MDFRLAALASSLLLVIASVCEARGYQYLSAPRIVTFDKKTDDGGSYSLFIVAMQKRVRIDAYRSIPAANDAGYIETFANFTGKPIERPLRRDLIDRKFAPVVAGKYVVPSTYRAKIRARTADGKVIQGVLETTMNTAPSQEINGVKYGRCKMTYLQENPFRSFNPRDQSQEIHHKTDGLQRA
jgi:hypothetical protein